ncbi:MAG TPA: 23S rRNA (adenine(2503)-C2)-methyltransferase, partial [Opitutaceae bacterium]
MKTTAPLNLYDLTREQLRVQLVRWEFSPVHAEKLWNYLYLQLATAFTEEAMPELPAKVRTKLAAEATLGILPTALETDSSD